MESKVDNLYSFHLREKQEQTREYATVFKCEYCGNDICDTDTYYDFDGETICVDCVDYYVKKNYRRVATI